MPIKFLENGGRIFTRVRYMHGPMHVLLTFFYSVHNLFVFTVAVNEDGDTPLSSACFRGDLEMIKALINKHVDPSSKCLSVLLRC